MEEINIREISAERAKLIADYIEKNYVEQPRPCILYALRTCSDENADEICFDEAIAETFSAEKAPRSLTDYVGEGEKRETFSEMLLRLIDEKGYTDSEIYKRALVDRRLFSKIRGNREYGASKSTVFAFALALCLSLDEATDLLAVSGFGFNMSSKFDLIVRYCIEEKIYDLMEVNEALYSFGQNTIGA